MKIQTKLSIGDLVYILYIHVDPTPNKKCSKCKGEGTKRTSSTKKGWKSETTSTCTKCDGKGETFVDGHSYKIKYERKNRCRVSEIEIKKTEDRQKEIYTVLIEKNHHLGSTAFSEEEPSIYIKDHRLFKSKIKADDFIKKWSNKKFNGDRYHDVEMT